MKLTERTSSVTMKDRILLILKDDRLSLSIDFESAADKLEIYLSEWRKWNEKINLTSEHDEQSLLEKHIFHSFQYCRAIVPRSRVLDIGSGAGFPGIPIKIVFPDLALLLVESQRKRANFLRHVIRSMGLGSVTVAQDRVENLVENHSEQYDFAVIRAFGELSDCLKAAHPLVRKGGRIIIKKEAEASSPEKSELKRSGFKEHVSIPMTDYHANLSKIMIFEKCST